MIRSYSVTVFTITAVAACWVLHELKGPEAVAAVFIASTVAAFLVQWLDQILERRAELRAEQSEELHRRVEGRDRWEP